MKIFGLVLPIFFIFNALWQSNLSSDIEYGSGFQNLPNYLVFFATVLSVYLLYRTLASQQKSNKLSAFENRLFKFLDYHRENVIQMKYRNPKVSEERYWEGTQVFTVVFYEVCDLIKQIESRKKLNSIQEKMEAINFSYQCVFYGAGEHGLKMLMEHFPNHPFFDYIDFKDKRAAYSSKEIFGRKEEKYFSGHVRRLGHYFRNIYQAIQYIEVQDFLSVEQKYEYTAHFRAQMSVYEQSVFFFNSISSLGNVWEWENYAMQNPTEKKKKKQTYTKLLITKYDLVKNAFNMEGFFASDLSIKLFYPLLNLERSVECAVYGILPFRNNDKFICRYCLNENYLGNDNEGSRQKFREQTIEHFSQANEEELSAFKCDENNCRTSQIIDNLKRLGKNGRKKV